MFSLFRENVRIAFDSIKSQLLRTILTVLIIGIGITALVGILSAVNALGHSLTENFMSMGTNTFSLQQYSSKVMAQGVGEEEIINPDIGYREVREFKETYNFPMTKTAISFTGTNAAEIKYADEKTDPEASVLGVNEHFIANSGLKLQEGRGFSYFDIENNTNVCVVGSDIKKALFSGRSPLGKSIGVRGNKFKIIGVLESKGSTFQNNEDLRVLIPIQAARSIFTLPNINYHINVKVMDKNMMDAAQDEAVLTFRNIRGLSPSEENNFGIARSDSLLNQIAKITGFLNAAAWIISIITIFGSSIALMNIMLVSVTERTREIGVRKALGAKKNTIAMQFFMETIIIGQLGGILGIFLGICIGYAVSSAAGFAFVTPWAAIIWATVISLIIAVVSGSYPASKAARQNPIESLRYE